MGRNGRENDTNNRYSLLRCQSEAAEWEANVKVFRIEVTTC